MPLDLGRYVPLLQVYDMPASVRFYSEVLGFDVVTRSPTYATEQGANLFHWAALRRDGSEIMLNTAYNQGERPLQPDTARLAAHGDTVLHFDTPDCDAAYAFLQSHSIACTPPHTTYYGMREVCFRDPDGYRISLQHPVAEPPPPTQS